MPQRGLNVKEESTKAESEAKGNRRIDSRSRSFLRRGGLTRGLENAGIDVRLGIDIDPACEYPYTENNDASFLLKSVEDITAEDFSDAFDNAPFKLLAGCAPCQPFSTYSQAWSCPSDERWNLLEHFSRLVKETRPHPVTMENVPPRTCSRTSWQCWRTRISMFFIPSSIAPTTACRSNVKDSWCWPRRSARSKSSDRRHRKAVELR